MEKSKNGGTKKWVVYNLNSYENRWLRVPLFQETAILFFLFCVVIGKALTTRERRWGSIGLIFLIAFSETPRILSEPWLKKNQEIWDHLILTALNFKRNDHYSNSTMRSNWALPCVSLAQTNWACICHTISTCSTRDSRRCGARSIVRWSQEIRRVTHPVPKCFSMPRCSKVRYITNTPGGCGDDSAFHSSWMAQGPSFSPWIDDSNGLQLTAFPLTKKRMKWYHPAILNMAGWKEKGPCGDKFEVSVGDYLLFPANKHGLIPLGLTTKLGYTGIYIYIYSLFLRTQKSLLLKSSNLLANHHPAGFSLHDSQRNTEDSGAKMLLCVGPLAMHVGWKPPWFL